ncbi:hypothetical protein [Swaminathania salitolerans]|nr:hypothetical protein [Swaminathania salitolerans]
MRRPLPREASGAYAELRLAVPEKIREKPENDIGAHQDRDGYRPW